MEALKGLYHADKLDEQTFIDNFTIRLKEYQQIMDKLQQQKQKPLQHFLITGKRGMGKSTLLRRIFIEASLAPLNEKLFAVRLGAEQYRLSRLFKMWELVIEDLGNKNPELLEQKKQIESSKQYEENLLYIIKDFLTQTGKTLLLLVDNFDQFIDKIPDKDKHTLRETLMQYPIQIIGNTIFYNENFKSYNNPFFDFFKPIHLQNLDKEEAEEFIKLRAAGEGIENFEEIFKKQKGKISTLRILSGGVPRTLLILLSIISKKNTSDAVDYLHEMIEQVTPLYQDRMKSLSPQQQEIMHHLAMHWDRTPVKELATEMRVPSKSISAQLSQLESSGYINKIDIPGRNNYYEIDERFFNIWLLMSEAQPYDTKRVIWLTRWLDAFYSNEELRDFANFCHNGLKSANPANRFLIAQALSESEKLEDGHKKKMVAETAAELKDKITEIKLWEEAYKKKLSDKENRLADAITEQINKKEFDKALENLDILETINEPFALSGKGYLYDIKGDKESAIKYYLIAVEKEDAMAMYNLASLYEDKNDIDNAEKYYLMAVEKDHSEAMFNLAFLYMKEKKDIINAEKYYLMAVEKEDAMAMYNLAILYKNEKKDIINAEKYYLMAIEKEETEAMYNLAILYQEKTNDVTSSEKYYLMAVEKGHTLAMGNLALLYYHANKASQKNTALTLANQAVDKEHGKNIINLSIYITMLLWNEKLNEAKKSILELLSGSLHNEANQSITSLILIRLLVFKQKQLLYKIFSFNEEWTDRYKPVYYAMLHEMQEEHPKEYLKITEELQEPVNSILEYIKEEQERLGL